VAEAVNDGTGANWQLANLFPHKVLRGDFEPGFRITHMAKDLRIAAEVAAEYGLELPELDLARARLDDAIAQFGDDRDYGAVARLVGW
ncbi:MAG TPA: NAD-binding protein, partial [Acidimicrobiia bacterium]